MSSLTAKRYEEKESEEYYNPSCPSCGKKDGNYDPDKDKCSKCKVK